MDSAKDLCRIINQSVENDDLLQGEQFNFQRFAALIESGVSDRNIMLANDEELEQMGQLTEDDLDIFRGLPSADRASVGQSPAMGTDFKLFFLTKCPAPTVFSIIFSQVQKC